MKINILPSKCLEFIEMHFSDGQYVTMSAKDAHKLKESIRRSLSVVSLDQELEYNEEPDFECAECTPFMKDF